MKPSYKLPKQSCKVYHLGNSPCSIDPPNLFPLTLLLVGAPFHVLAFAGQLVRSSSNTWPIGRIRPLKISKPNSGRCSPGKETIIGPDGSFETWILAIGLRYPFLNLREEESAVNNLTHKLSQPEKMSNVFCKNSDEVHPRGEMLWDPETSSGWQERAFSGIPSCLKKVLLTSILPCVRPCCN